QPAAAHARTSPPVAQNTLPWSAARESTEPCPDVTSLTDAVLQAPMRHRLMAPPDAQKRSTPSVTTPWMLGWLSATAAGDLPQPPTAHDWTFPPLKSPQ